MDLKRILKDTIGIRESHVKVCVTGRALCLAHKEWLQQVIDTKSVPKEYLHNNLLNDTECEILVHQSPAALTPPYTFVSVLPIKKIENRYVSLKLKEPWSRSHDLGYLELIRYVSETNYRNMWKEANFSNYGSLDKPMKYTTKEKSVKEYNTTVREVLHKLYGCPIISVCEEPTCEGGGSNGTEQGQTHPNLVPAAFVVETSSEFLVFLEYREHTLEDCAMFSSAVLVGSRLLFIVYQLLRLLRYIHDLGLPLGPMTLRDINLDSRYWMQAVPPWWIALEKESKGEMHLDSTASSSRKSSPQKDLMNDSSDNTELQLNRLVDDWVKGGLGNFDYLMALNKLCGREFGNPRHHPVLPWVRDLSHPDGGWRDLTRSKFRLTRGDQQLDVTYESAGVFHTSSTTTAVDRAVQVPHHVSETLPDITYYVYMARRLPRSILCQHVRQKWVPAEYPVSIQRLQEWTPNECIPEFFTDSSIFKSIHEDLPDLEVPSWCSGPEDFIEKHMAALECDRVSEHLHHWIDITFGYKLTGAAAVKNKNVCLPLVDEHTSLHNCGVVQLFTAPHPHRAGPSIYFSRFSAPKTFRLQQPRSGSPVVKHSASTSARRKSRTDGSSEKDVQNSDAKDGGEDESTDSSQKYKKVASIVKSWSVGQQLSGNPGTGSLTLPEQQTIVLPKDYNPLVKLQQLESLCSFSLTHAPYAVPSLALSADKLNSRSPSQTGHNARTADMFVLGCLLVEMSAFSSTAPYASRDLNCRYAHAVHFLKLYSNKLPKCLQAAVQLLLQTGRPRPTLPDGSFEWRYPCVCDSGLPPPSAHQLLQPLLPILPFPGLYPSLYEFLARMDALQVPTEKVKHASQELPHLLAAIRGSDLELMMGHLNDLFSHEEVSLLAVWQLFEMVGQALGPKATSEHLLGVLVALLGCEQPTTKHLRLFHRSFLLQLQVRLGMKTFLQHFATLLVEAVGSYGDASFQHISVPGSDTVPRKSSHLSAPELDNLGEADTTLQNEPLQEFTEDAHMPDDNKLPTSQACEQLPEPEIFVLETGVEESSSSEDKVREDEVSSSYPEAHFSVWSSSPKHEPRKETPKDSDEEVQEANESSSSCASYPPPSNIEEVRQAERPPVESSGSSSSSNCSLSDVAAESVLWLAHRLGPVLTARHLTRNLLRMLTLCYMGPQQLLEANGPHPPNCVNLFDHWVVGDYTASKVLDTLSNVAMLYGENFITFQYLPHLADLLRLCKKHMTETLEAGLLGAVSLVKHILPYLSDTTLMNQLQELVLKNVVYPLVQLSSSLHLCFPSGVRGRLLLTYRIADVLYLVGLRIGFEMSRRHLSAVLRRFFSSFDRAHNAGSVADVQHLTPLEGPVDPGSAATLVKALEEIKEVFTAELAFMTYVPLCKLAGGIYMEQTLENYDLIMRLCETYDCQIVSEDNEAEGDGGSGKTGFKKTHYRLPSAGQDETIVSGEFGKNVEMVGNRIDVRLGEDSRLVVAGEVTNSAPKYDIDVVMRKMTNDHRHLKGNWLAYWEHEIGRSDKDTHFNFKQIKLQSFAGHSGSVRAIEVLDNENSFLSGSKDRTVKLWSLRSSGDGSSVVAPQWTYGNHRKTVLSVNFLSSLRVVGSCDSSVHIWDPFLGSCLKQLDTSKTHPVTALIAMPAPSTTFLAATANSTVRFLDARTWRYTHEFKVSTGSAGMVRSIAVGPSGNWLVVGHSSGIISVLDVRTGFMLGSWVAHDGEVLQTKAFSDKYFVSSSLDNSVAVWAAEDAKPHSHLKGATEPVTCLNLSQGEVISGTTANKINIHSSIDQRASFTTTKLRSDTFRGILSSMAVLPLNRLLLLGSDNGSITLHC
ncbi:WD repeat-containing protein 81-like isoform X2 [Ornithodoros turicata]|uniref:WD repeat-containing protein 81-like isoform X2 n=1 Tax=Ornithodoros turicata TaxID=34597 RepID=UPI00313A21B4